MSLAPDAVQLRSMNVGALHSTGDCPEYVTRRFTDEPLPPLVPGVVVAVDPGTVEDGTLVVVELVAVVDDDGTVVVDVSVDAFLCPLLQAASSTIPETTNA
jgi:hypothetical protein